MISRPEFVGDVETLYPCSGDLFICQQANLHIVGWYLFRHEVDSVYYVDAVNLNFDLFKTELIVANYRVSKGCVRRIPRSRYDAFLAYGHHPTLKTPFEVRKHAEPKRRDPVYESIYQRAAAECAELCLKFNLDSHGRKVVT